MVHEHFPISGSHGFLLIETLSHCGKMWQKLGFELSIFLGLLKSPFFQSSQVLAYPIRIHHEIMKVTMKFQDLHTVSLTLFILLKGDWTYILSLTLKLRSNMVCQSYGTTGVRKNSLGEIVHVNKKTIVRLVYFTLVLDNILLTVVGKLRKICFWTLCFQPHLIFQYLSYQCFYTNMLWRNLQTKQIKILISCLKL